MKEKGYHSFWEEALTTVFIVCLLFPAIAGSIAYFSSLPKDSIFFDILFAVLLIAILIIAIKTVIFLYNLIVGFIIWIRTR